MIKKGASRDSTKEEDCLSQFAEVLKKSQFPEFFRFVRNPWKNFFYGFIRGTGFGLGALIGTAVIVTLTSYIISLFADVPFVGSWLVELFGKITSK